MKVCIVTPNIRFADGQGRVNYEIAQYLIDQGHVVHLIASFVDADLLAQPNVIWHPIALPEWLPAILRNQLFGWRSSRLLAQLRPAIDVVHINGALSYYPADINASHFVHSNWLKSPLHHAQTDNPLLSAYYWLYTAICAFWEKWAYHTCEHIVAVSEFVKQSLIEDVDIKTEKITVIHNGVNLEEFRPLAVGEVNSLRHELGLSDDIFIVFFTGDIKISRKNLDLVLQALSKLPANIHLAIAGATVGSPYPAIAQAANLSDRVHFLGYRKDIPALLRGSDAFTLPAHYDPCPLAVLEALASGVPVITVPSVGNSSLIQTGENGFVLHNSHDLAGMTAVLAKLANDRAFAKTIGRAGRLTSEQLSWEVMAAQYEALYQKMMTTPAPILSYPDPASSVGHSY